MRNHLKGFKEGRDVRFIFLKFSLVALLKIEELRAGTLLGVVFTG